MVPVATIVVPAFRNPSLRAALTSLLEVDNGGVRAEVIVVLNGATREVRSIARDFEPLIVVADMQANLGIQGAFNHGFGLGQGEYLVQMQDDAQATPGWLGMLVEAVESAPDIGAAGALNINHLGELRDAGWVIWRDGTTSPALVDGLVDPDRYCERRAIDQHGSAGMLIRRTAWESVGGLDDAFYPAYYGDVDFCWRLRRRGWRILIEPRSRVRHTGSASTTASFRQFLLNRNHALFFGRHRESLILHGERSYDPTDVTREVVRAAAAPAGAPPPPPSARELEILKQRLAISLPEIAEREREIWNEFGIQVDQQQRQAKRPAEEAQRLGRAALALESELEAERLQSAKLGTILETSETRTHRIVTSRSWRYSEPFRRLAARIRRLRPGARR